MELFLPCFYGFLGAIGFGMIFNVRGLKLLMGCVGGFLSWLVYLLLAGCFETDIPQYFFGTVAMAVFSEVMARIFKSPVTVFLCPGLIPLVPGSTIYYTMEHFVNGEMDQCMEYGTYTIEIAAALALGILVTSSVVRLWSSGQRKFKLLRSRRAAAKGANSPRQQ